MVTPSGRSTSMVMAAITVPDDQESSDPVPTVDQHLSRTVAHRGHSGKPQKPWCSHLTPEEPSLGLLASVVESPSLASEGEKSDGQGDSLEDALPPSAIARCGTTRMRMGQGSFAVAYGLEGNIIAAADGHE